MTGFCYFAHRDAGESVQKASQKPQTEARAKAFF